MPTFPTILPFHTRLTPWGHPEMVHAPFSLPIKYHMPCVVYVNMIDVLLGDHPSVVDLSAPSAK